MRIVGLTSFIHNSSAALIDQGAVIAAADEERFTRHKFTGDFPEQALRFCLNQGGLSIGDVDALAFYWNPWRGLSHRLWLMVQHMPHSLAFFQGARDDDTAIRGDFRAWWNMVHVAAITRQAFPGEKTKFRRYYVPHHLAHAASAYYLSPWDDALILSLDGTGEWTTTLSARGRGQRIEKIRETSYPHSLGAFYGAITQYLGYRTYEDEWKVMGLAALGTPRLADRVRKLIQVQEGSFRLNLNYFHFQKADKGTWYSPRWTELFGSPRREDEPIESERFADLAASFQLVAEEVGLALVRSLLKQNKGCRKLCLAGGVALNAVLNGKILAETEVEDIFVQPAAGDNGAALGAALYVHHMQFNGERIAPLSSAALGPEYPEAGIIAALQAAGLNAEKIPDPAGWAARLLAEGKVIGWFQGRMEYGPRALGHRSILADPRRAEMKEIVNAKVKFRESFRPFAPAILAEHQSEYFTQAGSFPFMTVVLPIRPEKQALIPAVAHAGTGRLQTVERAANPRFHDLISAFHRLTGVPVVLNTSFNMQGEPIVCTPADAISTFLRSGLDALVMGDYLCLKTRL